MKNYLVNAKNSYSLRKFQEISSEKKKTVRHGFEKNVKHKFISSSQLLSMVSN